MTIRKIQSAISGLESGLIKAETCTHMLCKTTDEEEAAYLRTCLLGHIKELRSAFDAAWDACSAERAS